jgi:putative ABC transport system ATP-binding protein
VHEPSLLICDEPTSALDKDTGAQIMQMVRDLSRSPERCVVVVTHDHRIFRFADRIAEMEDGRIRRVVEDASLLDTNQL